MKNHIYTIALLLLSNIVLAQTDTENYIKSTAYQVETADGTTNANTSNSLTSDEKIESITYFDGLGRPIQSIAKQAGGQKQDIITPIVYDGFGRQVKEYMPYARATSSLDYELPASLMIDLDNQYLAKYGNDLDVNAPNPYSKKLIEASPLNRVLQQAAPGEDWKLGGGHEIEMGYYTNTGTEVRRYEVTLSFANNTHTPTLVLDTSAGNNNGYYLAGELYKMVTKDENHDGSSTKDHTTEEFKNKQGQVLLKRTYANEITHDTYYVYDIYGNLTYVIPPKVDTSNTITQAILDNLCYQYTYDGRNRLVEKKIPGKGWEYIVYNKLDQPIMTQDAIQRAKSNKEWLFTKYDAFGRVVYTGLYKDNGSRVSQQNLADSSSYVSEKIDGNVGLFYYTNTAFPTNIPYYDVYIINYYDNYVYWDGDTHNPSQNSFGKALKSNAKGLITTSKVKVLDVADSWVTTITGYDDKYRPVYIYSGNNYLNTTDIVESNLDFAGNVLETKSTHTKAENTITIVDYFDYDHMNRLLVHNQSIDNAALSETITSNTYDDLGQLVSKGVGAQQNLPSRLQTVNYDYNIRGWLKNINDVDNLGTDLFGFKINYNQTDISSSTALFNGNISETIWKTENDANTNQSYFNRAYSYSYDALNRITDANFKVKNSSGSYDDLNSGNYYLKGVTYDKNGNINSLKRTWAYYYAEIDDLIYTYDSGNKLLKVDDYGSTYSNLKDEGFKDGTNTGNDYIYDVNGNMTQDLNKGITNIEYNHLNLPISIDINGPFFTSSGNNGTISYVYDATGVKLKKRVTELYSKSILSDISTQYAGNFIYEDNSLKMFSTPEGYVEPVDETDLSLGFNYIYQYKDHLGNIRLSYFEDAPSEAIIDSDFNTGSTNPWIAASSAQISTTSGGELEVYQTQAYEGIQAIETIEQGRDYTIEFDVDIDQLDGQLHFVAYSPNSGIITNMHISSSGHYSFSFEGLHSESHQFIFRAWQLNSNSSFFVDNVVLLKEASLEIIEENNYYPFGLKHKGYNNVINGTDHPYGYGGKEENDELGLNALDFGARLYQPDTGRWFTIDALAEMYYDQSSYNYALNSPIVYYDPDGNAVEVCCDWNKIADAFNIKVGGAVGVGLKAKVTKHFSVGLSASVADVDYSISHDVLTVKFLGLKGNLTIGNKVFKTKGDVTVATIQIKGFQSIFKENGEGIDFKSFKFLTASGKANIYKLVNAQGEAFLIKYGENGWEFAGTDGKVAVDEVFENSDIAGEFKLGIKLKVGVDLGKLWDGITSDGDGTTGNTNQNQEACYDCERKKKEEARKKHNSDPARLHDGNFIKPNKIDN